jgi:hypothetical protein
LCLENLFEQVALIDARGRAHPETFAFLQQDYLVGVFAGEVEFVRHDNDRVAIFRSQATKRFKQVDLRADVEMERRLVEKK